MSGGLPRVSLGLPVFDGMQFLPQTVEALLGQSFTDFELILADNASTDGSLEWARELATREPRLRVLDSETNQGAAWNYNRVLDQARGAYFKWAAADDLCLPRYLERCVEALDGSPAAVLAYPRTRIIDAEGRDQGPYEDALGLGQPSPWRRFAGMLRVLRECNAVFGLIRRDALLRTQRIGSYTGSDLVLLGELVLQGPFLEVPEELFLRRDHPGQSVRAHPDLAQRDVWFDVRRQGRSRPMWRIGREYAAAVRRAPLSATQRTLALAALAFWWPRRKYPQLFAEALGRYSR